MAKSNKATETTETNNVSNSIPALTKQTGALPEGITSGGGGGSREGSLRSFLKGLAIGEWFAVDFKQDKEGKLVPNSSKAANIAVVAKDEGISIKRVGSKNNQTIYQRVERAAPAVAETEQPTE